MNISVNIDIPDDWNDGQVGSFLRDIETLKRSAAANEIAAAMPPVGAPGTPGPVAVGEVIIDDAGIPWDERIHAGSKTQTKTGVWKKRKGVDKETIKTVEAELIAGRQSTTAPAPVAEVAAPAPVAEVAAPAPVAEVAAPAPAPVAEVAAPAPVAEVAAPAPVAEVAAPAPVAEVAAPAPVAGELTWPVMLSKLTTAQTNGTYNEDRMNQLLEHYKVGSVAQLANRPDLFQSFVDDQWLGL